MLSVYETTLVDDWGRSAAKFMLGVALSRQGQFAEAEPLLREGEEQLRAASARMPVFRRQLLQEARSAVDVVSRR